MSTEEKVQVTKYKKNRKKWITILGSIVAAISVVTLVFSLIFYQQNRTFYISYTETSDVDYRVYLKDNDVYEEEYLEKGQSYVAELIDNVVADFSYELKMESNDVNYDYTYHIDAELVISDTRSDAPIFTKTNVLVPEETHSQSQGTLSITRQVSVNYDEYNDLANNFINTYRLSDVESTLILKSHVNVLSVCDDVSASNENEYVTSLNIPLTKKLVNVNISSSIPEAENKLIACEKGTVKNVFKVLTIVFGSLDAVAILALILFIFLSKNKFVVYSDTVRKILSSYESYIQILTNQFDMEGYQILKMGSIKDLLNIRETIQEPILMNENENQTVTKFIIPTNTKILYLYEVIVEGYESEGTQEIDITRLRSVQEEKEEVVVTPVEEVKPQVEEITPVVEETPIEETTPVVEENVTVEEIVDSGEAVGTLKNEDRFTYSFEAKLILSDYETKDYYKNIITFAKSYGVKVTRSFRKERIYLGRNLFAVLIFKGKTLCVGFPLDPKDYADSKYKFVDMSAYKKYHETPFLMKVTSELKVRYIQELLETLFKDANVENKHLEVSFKMIPTKSKNMLMKEGLIRSNNREKQTV